MNCLLRKLVPWATTNNKLLSNGMLESKQVRHFSQWDLQSLEYFRQFKTLILCFQDFISVSSGLYMYPVDPTHGFSVQLILSLQ